MAKVVRVKFTLQEAANVKTVWEANPDLKVGNAGLSDFMAVYVAAEGLDKDYATKDVELSGILGKREEKVRELRGLVVRFRDTIRGKFGPDSPEYGQAG